MFSGCITDVAGIKAGHYTDKEARTGCTFILAEQGAVASVDVRGGAPGTRETDAFAPGGMVPQMHGVMLSGGSAFGLASGDGAMRWLEEKGIGLDVGVAKVPLVGGAVIFDLANGRADVRPTADNGYQAAQNATDKALQQGVHGGGTGATVAKMLGLEHAVRGGVGAASMKIGKATLAAVVVVNALGNVYDYRNGELLAGMNPFAGQDEIQLPPAGSNTTIGLIATDAKLDKQQAHRLAMLGHDGMAMSIRPVHTMHDGDTVFSFATGKVEEQPDMLFAFAAEVFARAICNAVTRDDA